MSVQMAMMGAQMGLSVLQGINSAAGAVSQRAAARANASAAADQRIAGDQIREAQGYAAAAQTGTEIAGTQLQTQQQEIQRRRMIAQLWQANAIDLVGRGGVSTPGDSASVIQDYNQRIGEEDVANIRLMGESKVRALSFRQTQQDLWASSQALDIMNTGANLERQNQQGDEALGYQLTNLALGTLGKTVGMYKSEGEPQSPGGTGGP